MRNNEEPFDWCPVFYSPEFNALEEIRNRCTSTKLGTIYEPSYLWNAMDKENAKKFYNKIVKTFKPF